MALQHHNALSLLSISIILMIQPFIAHGSNRGSIGLTSKNASSQVAPPVQGICATSVRLHGYKCLEYDVETRDGYILSVQRVPEGISGGGGRRQPVLIQHGVLVVIEINARPEDDGSTWFLNPAEQNLPFILADQGFDVWIANTRGTRYSRRHRTLDPKQPAFWNWSWDELVTYDLPAAFEFVYTQTGQKIDYVGHSMGTLIALASFSEGRQVDKLKSAAFLSPIAYLSHMTTPIGVLAAKSFVGEITTLFGLAEFNPKGEAVGNFIRALCAYPGIDCYDLLTSFTGKNCCLNASTVELFLKFEPQSTSTKNMVHMAQTVRHGVVAKFNYGNKDLNLEHYGEVVPPLYNISNIPHDLPIFLSYGGKDALSDVRDVDLLLDGLKYHDGNKLTVQFIQNYAHADFIMGINAKDIVYKAMIAFFKRQ